MERRTDGRTDAWTVGCRRTGRTDRRTGGICICLYIYIYIYLLTRQGVAPATEVEGVGKGAKRSGRSLLREEAPVSVQQGEFNGLSAIGHGGVKQETMLSGSPGLCWQCFCWGPWEPSRRFNPLRPCSSQPGRLSKGGVGEWSQRYDRRHEGCVGATRPDSWRRRCGHSDQGHHDRCLWRPGCCGRRANSTRGCSTVVSKYMQHVFFLNPLANSVIMLGPVECSKRSWRNIVRVFLNMLNKTNVYAPNELKPVHNRFP